MNQSPRLSHSRDGGETLRTPEIIVSDIRDTIEGVPDAALRKTLQDQLAELLVAMGIRSEGQPADGQRVVSAEARVEATPASESGVETIPTAEECARALQQVRDAGRQDVLDGLKIEESAYESVLLVFSRYKENVPKFTEEVMALSTSEEIRALSQWLKGEDVGELKAQYVRLRVWGRVMFPSLRSGLHIVMAANEALKTYFSDTPATEQLRTVTKRLTEGVLKICQEAGIKVIVPELLQPQDKNVEVSYRTSPQFRTIPEIRGKVIETERAGGEFAVAVEEIGFHSDAGNTKATAVMFNPSAWA